MHIALGHRHLAAGNLVGAIEVEDRPCMASGGTCRGLLEALVHPSGRMPEEGILGSSGFLLETAQNYHFLEINQSLVLHWKAKETQGLGNNA